MALAISFSITTVIHMHEPRCGLTRSGHSRVSQSEGRAMGWIGGTGMGVFTKIEAFETVSVAADEIPDFVRPQRSPTDAQTVASDLASLIKRITASSVREIDHVIASVRSF